jgi:hypothetical protein
MDLRKLRAANVLIDELDEIDGKINKVKNHLGVTLYGAYQDEVICDVARPALLAHFNEKRAQIVAQLKELGVTAD